MRLGHLPGHLAIMNDDPERPATKNPLLPFLERAPGVMILDGGLATELEAHQDT